MREERGGEGKGMEGRGKEGWGGEACDTCSCLTAVYDGTGADCATQLVAPMTMTTVVMVTKKQPLPSRNCHLQVHFS